MCCSAWSAVPGMFPDRHRVAALLDWSMRKWYEVPCEKEGPVRHRCIMLCGTCSICSTRSMHSVSVA